MAKKLTKTQTKRLLNTARTALGKLLVEKIASGQGPMSIPALIDIGKKIDMASRKL